MIAYALRRLASVAVVMTLVAVSVFLLLRLAPGDPTAIITGDNATPAQIASVRERLGLDDPLPQQFYRWIRGVLSGDLGVSIFSNASVAELIGQRIEPTLSLTVATLLLAVPTALLLGILAAWRAGGIIDRFAMAISIAGFSLPGFVVGYFMLYIFAIRLKWLPVQGYTPIGEDIGQWAQHLVLPALTLSLAFIALLARMTRAAMLEVLAEDYIRTANAKGVGTRSLLLKHALRNAGIPIVTIVGIGVATLMGGVVITETIFNIPGIGRLVVDAILKRDYPIIQGVTLLASGVYVIINLLVDLSYSLIDPRIRS
jgi:peptide/nickel transport system permease protein